MLSRRFTLLLAVIVVLMVLSMLVVSCGGENPAPSSDDSGFSYESGSKIPVDHNYYDITGVVVADVESMTRQTEAASGSAIMWGSYARGTYFGPEFGGKGFIRILVSESDNYDLAPLGEIVILKSTDTKATILFPQDRVTFRCRAQYEAVGAVNTDESFDEDKAGTWELDFCRLVTPVVSVEE